MLTRSRFSGGGPVDWEDGKCGDLGEDHGDRGVTDPAPRREPTAGRTRWGPRLADRRSSKSPSTGDRTHGSLFIIIW
eukprot:6818626-Prymnesium_polylepis.1